jgi:hypothetical protein
MRGRLCRDRSRPASWRWSERPDAPCEHLGAFSLFPELDFLAASSTVDSEAWKPKGMEWQPKQDVMKH